MRTLILMSLFAVSGVALAMLVRVPHETVAPTQLMPCSTELTADNSPSINLLLVLPECTSCSTRHYDSEIQLALQDSSKSAIAVVTGEDTGKGYQGIEKLKRVDVRSNSDLEPCPGTYKKRIVSGGERWTLD